VFGPAYTEMLGRARLATAPTARVDELSGECFYVQLTDSTRDVFERWSEVHTVRRAVVEHPGRTVFFDPSAGESRPYDVPAFDA
jgi:hypothetical protein